MLGNQRRLEGRIMATELRLLFRLCVPDQLLLIVYAVERPFPQSQSSLSQVKLCVC